jgi:pyruvate dehydrogenase E1 component alpha subunit
MSLNGLIAENYGKVTGTCQGFGFINSCDPERGIYGLGGTVGGEATLAAGVALAAKLKGTGQVVCYFFGDGAIGEGAVHAAMLMAANWKLPMIFVCSNNGMSMFVPVEVAYPKQNIADWAFGYNIPATIADGQDVETTYNTSQAAIERARRGEGPTFIEFKTCRNRPQCEGLPDFSMEGLRSEAVVEAWKQRDPINLYQERLLSEGLLSKAEFERIDREVASEIVAAEKFAKESPEPTMELLEQALYAE